MSELAGIKLSCCPYEIISRNFLKIHKTEVEQVEEKCPYLCTCLARHDDTEYFRISFTQRARD